MEINTYLNGNFDYYNEYNTLHVIYNKDIRKRMVEEINAIAYEMVEFTGKKEGRIALIINFDKTSKKLDEDLQADVYLYDKNDRVLEVDEHLGANEAALFRGLYNLDVINNWSGLQKGQIRINMKFKI